MLGALREAFGFSQGEIVRRLEAGELIDAKHVSKFELGERAEPLGASALRATGRGFDRRAGR